MSLHIVVNHKWCYQDGWMDGWTDYTDRIWCMSQFLVPSLPCTGYYWQHCKWIWHQLIPPMLMGCSKLLAGWAVTTRYCSMCWLRPLQTMQTAGTHLKIRVQCLQNKVLTCHLNMCRSPHFDPDIVLVSVNSHWALKLKADFSVIHFNDKNLLQMTVDALYTRTYIFTSHISGRGNIIGPVCVSVCVHSHCWTGWPMTDFNWPHSLSKQADN